MNYMIKGIQALKESVFLGIIIYIVIFVLLYLFKKRRTISWNYMFEGIFCIYCVTLLNLTGIFTLSYSLNGPFNYCSRSKFLSKLLKTFDKTFREIFPVFISTKRREKPSAFFDNNFVNNAYFSEAASSSSSHLASSSSKAPISSRMTCLCLWSS